MIEDETDDEIMPEDDGRSSVIGGGCEHCGYAGGSCMSPGDHCPLAKKMFAPKPVTTLPTDDSAQALAQALEKLYVPNDQGGVWVTYYSKGDGDERSVFSVYQDELSALRVAVEYGHRAVFLKWGELL